MLTGGARHDDTGIHQEDGIDSVIMRRFEGGVVRATCPLI